MPHDQPSQASARADDGSFAHASGLERPRTRAQLRRFIHQYLDIVLADTPIIEGHQSPLDYLTHAFFEGEPPPDDAVIHLPVILALPPPPGMNHPAPPGPIDDAQSPALLAMLDAAREPAPDFTFPTVDCVVWANRGGGKTMLGAVATLMDMVFKDGIQIRILGGSLEQAQRMHEHLRGFLSREPFAAMVSGRITDKRIALVNGSVVELLAQSQTSVRGTRVQRLRCDEVELFDPGVWEAAQLVTRSKLCGGEMVRGSVECLSTMHVPYGIMHDLVTQAVQGRRRLFKWGVVDVLERCEPKRSCESCSLLPECQGKAKRSPHEAGGHISISDAVVMKSRVALSTWESEMLCTRPSRSATVVPEFTPVRHVVDSIPQFDPAVPGVKWVGGMDFGYRAPTAILWGMVDPAGTLWIDRERVVSQVVLQEHIDAINDPASPRLAWLAVDPAGGQTSSQSGASSIDLMRKARIPVQFQAFRVLDGILLIRARLRPADHAPPRLFVHQRCHTLIESLERYSYNADPESETPEKGKGFDHAVDALRYLVQWLDSPRTCVTASYTDAPY